MSLTRLYATAGYTVLESAGKHFRLPPAYTIDSFFTAEDPIGRAAEALKAGSAIDEPADDTLRAPIGHQEVWAAGVTYLRSKTARMEESKDGGGGTFYDRVYEADR